VKTQPGIIAVVMRLLCVLGLAVAGLAHADAGAFASSTEMTSYVFPDGSVASLCLPGEDDGSGKASHAKGCDVCCLAVPALMPSTTRSHARTIVFSSAARMRERQYRLVRPLYPPSSGPRAPPHRLRLI
jgi:hypothetical protein